MHLLLGMVGKRLRRWCGEPGSKEIGAVVRCGLHCLIPSCSCQSWPGLLKCKFNFFVQQNGGFRKVPRKVKLCKTNLRTRKEAYKRSALILPVDDVFYYLPYPIRTLIKPFIFHCWVYRFCVGSATIQQYESLMSRVQNYFDGTKADWLDCIRLQKGRNFRKEH